MNHTIKIADKTIGPDHPPFIVAEMSGNHNQSIERAFEIIDAAADAGAHALKIQTYTADTMTLDIKQDEFVVQDSNGLWEGQSFYELYQKAYTPWEWHEQIFERCRQKGVIGFSTPFDESAVKFLEKLGAPAYKIASFENTDLPLIRAVARTGKPTIISTGMASISELGEAVEAFRQESQHDNLIILKCTSTYPALPVDTNLRTIPHMRELFDLQVGLSDHTMGVGASIAAVALGATFIEKHFTLARADGGVDSAFSLEPRELKSLVVESERAWQAMGKVNYGPTNKEKDSLNFRRSLYVTEDLKSGDTLTEQNLRRIRPGRGLPSKFYDLLLGKRVHKDIKKGTAVSWDIFN